MVVDSRRVGPGSLFVAVAGEHVDGHDFAAAAVAAWRRRRAGAADRSGCLRSWSTAGPTAVVAALGRLASRGAGRGAGRDRHGDHRVERQDQHEGPRRAGAPAGWADAGAGGVVQQRSRACRSRCCGSSRRCVTSCSRWVPAVRGTSPGSAGSRRRGSASCSTSAPRTSASSARRAAIAAAKGELVEALPADGTAVLNADDPYVVAMAERSAAPVLWFGDWCRGCRCITGASALPRRRLDDEGRPAFRLHTPAGVGRRRGCSSSASTTSANALAAAAIAHCVGLGADEIAAALSAAGRAQPLAHGGPPAPGRRDGDQRRVQREPRQRAGRAARAGRGRAWWPDLGRAR